MLTFPQACRQNPTITLVLMHQLLEMTQTIEPVVLMVLLLFSAALNDLQRAVLKRGPKYTNSLSLQVQH